MNGKNYNTKHSNFDTIIAVEYCVNSKCTTVFRPNITPLPSGDS